LGAKSSSIIHQYIRGAKCLSNGLERRSDGRFVRDIGADWKDLNVGVDPTDLKLRVLEVRNISGK
jgi:hypothetical protein